MNLTVMRMIEENQKKFIKVISILIEIIVIEIQIDIIQENMKNYLQDVMTLVKIKRMYHQMMIQQFTIIDRKRNQNRKKENPRKKIKVKDIMMIQVKMRNGTRKKRKKVKDHDQDLEGDGSYYFKGYNVSRKKFFFSLEKLLYFLFCFLFYVGKKVKL